MHISWLHLCTPSGLSPSPEGLVIIFLSAITAPHDSTTLEINQPVNRQVTKQNLQTELNKENVRKCILKLIPKLTNPLSIWKEEKPEQCWFKTKDILKPA